MTCLWRSLNIAQIVQMIPSCLTLQIVKVYAFFFFFFFDKHVHLCSLLKGWISEHNISEFLRSQAEMIESG